MPDVSEEDAIPTSYNFHDFFTVRVAHPGLNALMRTELASFISDVNSVDLRVESGEVPPPDRVPLRGDPFNEPNAVTETPSGSILLAKDLIRAGPVFPSELLRWVTYAMRRHLLEKDVSFLHAAAVSRDGLGCVIPAWAHSGKTNLHLNLLTNGYDYMSDDWSFLSASGEVFAYPRHLRLYWPNFACHPHLVEALGNGRERRRVRRQLAAAQFAQSLDGSNWLAGVAQQWLSDRFFVNVKTPVSRLIPGCRTVLRATLAKVVTLTSAKSGVDIVPNVSPKQLARKVA
ncbi:MAG: hypothetical protein V3U33_06475, partial [candidate division NC10 bacterium]